MVVLLAVAGALLGAATASAEVRGVSVGRVSLAPGGVPIGVVRVVQRGATTAPSRLTIRIGEWGGEFVGSYTEPACARRGTCRRTIPVAGFASRAGAPVRLKPLTLYLVSADAGPGRAPVLTAFVAA